MQRREFAERVSTICHEVGFFLLIGHGMEELVRDVFAIMRRLFALPPSEKARIDKRRSPHFRGWEAEGSGPPPR